MSKGRHLKDDPRYQNHESRPDLAGEHVWGDFLQLITFILFLGITVLDYLFLKSYPLMRSFLPLWFRLSISICLFALAGYLSLYGIKIVFGEYRDKPVMITKGMFSFIRHPIYLGALLVYLAVFMLTTSLISLFVWVVAIYLYNWLANDEEERMLKIFGKQYQEYIKQVSKWIPHPRSFTQFRKKG